ncbi:hypothetical protein POSPLADRAFT_1092306, partial [Postia placenta MAD-698-R-SB12]
FRRVLQCRTGHCFKGEYYRHFIPNEPDDCPCGNPADTRPHPARLPPVRAGLPTILGTAEEITALIGRSGTITKTGTPR